MASQVSRLRDALRPVLSVPPWLIAAVATILAWPVRSVLPDTGLDSGYRYALSAWATGRLGDRPIVYTYGPLGFLNVPQAWYRGPYLLQILFTAAVLGALALLIARRVDRAVTAVVRGTGAPVVARVLAALVAWVVAATSFTSGAIEPAVLVALLVQAEAWDGALSARTALWTVGAATPVLILVKPTSGGLLVPLLVAAALTLAAPWRQRLLSAGTAIAAVIVATVLLWLALGHPASQLDDYLHGVFDYTTGYDVQALELPGNHWEYVAAAVAAAGVLALAVLRPDRRRPVGIAVLAMWVIVLYVDFKHGFTRHDAHSIAYFSATLVGALAVWHIPRRAPAGGEHVDRADREDRPAPAVTASIAAATLVAFIGATLLYLTVDLAPAVRQPLSAARRAVHQLAVGLDGARWDATTRAGRAQITAALPVPDELLARIGSGTVDLLPFQDAVIWAYRLHYAPMPVLQPDTAFTTWLDGLDVREITGPDAPDFILSTPRQAALDSRYPPANSGGYQLQLLCRYRPVLTGRLWTLLERTANRCGTPTRLAQVVVHAGQPIAVPTLPAGQQAYLVARITPHPGFGFALRKLLFKTTTIPQLVVDGRAFRFLWTAPGQPTPLSSVRLGGDGKVTVSTVHTLELRRLPGAITVVFEAVPYH